MVDLDQLGDLLGFGVIDLAASLSIAAEIDPALLRVTRRRLHPGITHEAEAVLFHSALAESRGRHGFVISESLLPELRWQLVDKGRLDAAAAVLTEVHAYLPAPLLLEERLIYELLADRDPYAVEELLGWVARWLRDATDRKPASRWILRAFRRAPEKLRTDPRFAPQAFNLAQVASAVLGGAVFGHRSPLTGTAPILPVLGERTIDVGARLHPGGLVFSGRAEGSTSLPVPAAWPIVLKIDGADGETTTVLLDDQSAMVAAPVRLPATVNTVAGERFKVAQAESRVADLRVPLDAIAWSISPEMLVTVSSSSRQVVLLSSDTLDRIDSLMLPVDVVDEIALAGTGRQLAVGSRGSVTVWDLPNLAQSARLDSQVQDLKALGLSEYGSTLVAAGASGTVIWQLSTHQGLELPPMSGPLAVSPSAALLVSTAQDGSAQVWETTRRSQPALLEAPSPTALAWSQDSRMVAVGGQDGRVVLADVESRAFRGGKPAHEAPVVVLAFSPDQDMVASGDAAGVIHVWEVSDLSRPTQTWSVPDRHVRALAWSPDGARVASAGADGIVRLWQVLRTVAPPQAATRAGPPGEAGIQLTALPAGHGTCIALELGSSDRRFRMVIDGGPRNSYRRGLKAWIEALPDPQRGIDVLVVTHTDEGSIGGVLELLQDRSVAVEIADIWSNGWRQIAPPDQSATERREASPAYEIWSLAWSPSEDLLAIAGSEQAACIVNAGTRTVRTELSGHTAPINAIAWSPDGQMLATASDDNSVRVWNAASGVQLSALIGHTGWVNDVAWSPDGSLLASASADGTALLWDARSGSRIAALLGHEGRVLSVAWAPDGTRVATSSEDGTARIWDVGSASTISVLTEHVDRVVCAAWAPEGDHLATLGGDGTAIIWEGPGAVPVARRTGLSRSGWGDSIAWSPGSDLVASISADGACLIWNSTTIDTVITLPNSGSAELTSVAWSFDGSRLAIGSTGGEVSVWIPTTGVLLGTYRSERRRTRTEIATGLSRDPVTMTMIARSGLLDSLAGEIPINRATDGRPLVLPQRGPLPAYELPGSVRITLLSPDMAGLDRVTALWRRDMEAAGLSLPEEADLEHFNPTAEVATETDQNAEARANDLLRAPRNSSFGGDNAVANGSSLAFLVEHGETSCLITGDAHAARLERSLSQLLQERGLVRFPLNLMVLPHNGSKQNITPSLLDLLDCHRFVISTDGARFHHPDPEVIELLGRQRSTPTTVYFNYRSATTGVYSDEDVQRRLNIVAVFPEDGRSLTVFAATTAPADDDNEPKPSQNVHDYSTPRNTPKRGLLDLAGPAEEDLHAALDIARRALRALGQVERGSTLPDGIERRSYADQLFIHERTAASIISPIEQLQTEMAALALAIHDVDAPMGLLTAQHEQSLGALFMLVDELAAVCGDLSERVTRCSTQIMALSKLTDDYRPAVIALHEVRSLAEDIRATVDSLPRHTGIE